MLSKSSRWIGISVSALFSVITIFAIFVITKLSLVHRIARNPEGPALFPRSVGCSIFLV